LAVCSARSKALDHDAHNWIHSQLHLTDSQEKALEPIEARYHDKSKVLEEQMRSGNAELAKAILASGQDSAEVRAAIEKIHMAMGELQNITIGHVFEMRTVLTSEQYNKLLHLTADALCNLDSEHAGR
jgi:Spy/CpxP family protein refolding chaperone